MKAGDVELKGPLLGRVVALVRPVERAGLWKEALQAAGAKVLLAPAIAIAPPEDSRPLDDALGRLAARRSFDWLVFTSAAGVEHTVKRFVSLGFDLKLLSACRLAAVGKATARELVRFGLRAHKVPDRQDAEGLLESFSKEELAETSILMPRAAGGREVFPDGARASGAMVEVVEAYRTIETPSKLGPLREELEAGRIDALVLGSPSQVRSVSRALVDGHRLLRRVLVACIGSTTAHAAEAAGMKPHIAGSPEPEAMVELLIARLCWVRVDN